MRDSACQAHAPLPPLCLAHFPQPKGVELLNLLCKPPQPLPLRRVGGGRLGLGVLPVGAHAGDGGSVLCSLRGAAVVDVAHLEGCVAAGRGRIR